MQTIDTGYKPEFGLGAYFAGQNAANADDLNQAELIKSFLANQQAKQKYDQDTQMNPLLITEQQNKNTVGDYDAALATLKNESPTYKNILLKGTEGQMQSQITASEKGKALLPFQIAAEQAAAETDKNRQGVLWTMQNLDKQLAAGGDTDAAGNIVPFTPMQKMFMENKRAELTDQLKNTPEFAGKKELSDDKIEAQLEAQRIRMQGQLDAAEQKATKAAEKALSDKQLYAKAYQMVHGLTPATEQQKLAAQAILDGMQADAIGKNAALTNPTMDLNALSDGKIPMNTPASVEARKKAEASKAAAASGGTTDIPKDTIVPKSAKDLDDAPVGTVYRGKTKKSDGMYH